MIRRTIRLNGESLAVDAKDVAELMAGMGYASGGGGVAVAVNGEVIPRGRWSHQGLDDGDEVEVVGATQGG